MGILNAILGVFGINKSPRQINIKNLPSELQKLMNGETEFDFIGITSDGIDCIYFVKDGNNFQIEFEAMTDQQTRYIEKLREFAGSSGYSFSMTTYGNRPEHDAAAEAPVIRIETNSDLTKTSEIGELIQASIFSNTDETIYDVVP